LDFELSEDQKMFQVMVRDFAAKELAPGAAKRDEDATFPGEAIKKMGELGLLGVSYPEKYGGSGGDSVQQAILDRVCRHGIVMLLPHIQVRFGRSQEKALARTDARK